ncbi:DUF559 domain-containing protein [Mariprofundus erugo]|uniref:DUF559 domain-containing protein n=1 Tax=Mariprofundus erugo TaxID=2528639 RepID=UPI0010FE2225|nr:DUF559 domain-containing protein [Mariprofundus erugo]TLS75054.1 DUF559 domain-containing protein [Mariprofundus erugo]
MAKVEKWKNDYRNYDSRCPEVDDTKYLLENNSIMTSFLRAAGFHFSEENYFHNKTVPDSGIRNRPDHRFIKEKVIIEFDGLQHYQNIDVIKKDRKKDAVYGKMGYRIIRVPFFIQPSTETLNHYFHIEGELQLQYPHGFIIYDSTPPTYFCSLGLERFIDEFNKLPDTVKNDIVKSLDKLISLGEQKEYVIPKQCERMFNRYR